MTVLSNFRTKRQRKIPSAEKDPLGVGLLAQDAEFGGDRSRKILDIGCGTGRHAIEPAKRDYEVTGIDLSESQIVKARNKVEATGVQVDFIVGDVREKHFDKALEVALMICEGAFPLMETDEMNFRILENAMCALEPGGKLMLTTLSALFPLFHSVKDFLAAAGVKSDENTFDLVTFYDHSKVEFADDAGRAKTLVCDERYYAPSEITWMLKIAGLQDRRHQRDQARQVQPGRSSDAGKFRDARHLGFIEAFIAEEEKEGNSAEPIGLKPLGDGEQMLMSVGDRGRDLD